MIPIRVENLLAANKNIGTTHITNGCYRLHPVEWNIGEAAGVLAAFAIEQSKRPRSIREDQTLLRAFQKEVVGEGVSLCWLIDVPVWSPDFAATQRLVVARGYGGKSDGLEFDPDKPVTAEDRAVWLVGVEGGGSNDLCGDRNFSRAAFAQAMLEAGQI